MGKSKKKRKRKEKVKNTEDQIINTGKKQKKDESKEDADTDIPSVLPSSQSFPVTPEKKKGKKVSEKSEKHLKGTQHASDDKKKKKKKKKEEEEKNKELLDVEVRPTPLSCESFPPTPDTGKRKRKKSCTTHTFWAFSINT